MSEVDTPNQNLIDLINAIVNDMRAQADVWSDPSDMDNISDDEELIWQWCASMMRRMANKAERVLKEIS